MNDIALTEQDLAALAVSVTGVRTTVQDSEHQAGRNAILADALGADTALPDALTALALSLTRGVGVVDDDLGICEQAVTRISEAFTTADDGIARDAQALR